MRLPCCAFTAPPDGSRGPMDRHLQALPSHCPLCIHRVLNCSEPFQRITHLQPSVAEIAERSFPQHAGLQLLSTTPFEQDFTCCPKAIQVHTSLTAASQCCYDQSLLCSQGNKTWIGWMHIHTEVFSHSTTISLLRLS